MVKDLSQINSIEMEELTPDQASVNFDAEQLKLDESNVKCYKSTYHINYKVGADNARKYSKDSYEVSFAVVKESDETGWQLAHGLIYF